MAAGETDCAFGVGLVVVGFLADGAEAVVLGEVGGVDFWEGVDLVGNQIIKKNQLGDVGITFIATLFVISKVESGKAQSLER